MCKPPTCGLYQNRPCVRAESLGDGRHGWGSLNRPLPAGPSAGTQEGGVGAARIPGLVVCKLTSIFLLPRPAPGSPWFLGLLSVVSVTCRQPPPESIKRRIPEQAAHKF